MSPVSAAPAVSWSDSNFSPFSASVVSAFSVSAVSVFSASGVFVSVLPFVSSSTAAAFLFLPLKDSDLLLHLHYRQSKWFLLLLPFQLPLYHVYCLLLLRCCWRVCIHGKSVVLFFLLLVYFQVIIIFRRELRRIKYLVSGCENEGGSCSPLISNNLCSFFIRSSGFSSKRSVSERAVTSRMTAPPLSSYFVTSYPTLERSFAIHLPP